MVGVVTHNPMATLRFELLEQTVRSIERAFPTAALFLIDNGSTDGSWPTVQELLGPKGIACAECGREQECGRWHTARDTADPRDNFTPGAGRHRLYYHMFRHTQNGEHRAPFWVWSDDDMKWKEGAERKLRHFWYEAPPDIVIASGLLEPVWHWNTPRRVVEAGGVRALVRDSAPGAAWTFREPRDIPVPSNEKMMRFGYDFESCKLLREHHLLVAQLDLADHIGWGYSTHGNEANHHVDARPLDREKWGV